MPSALRPRFVGAALTVLVIAALVFVLHASFSPSKPGTVLWGLQVPPDTAAKQIEAVGALSKQLGKHPSVFPINLPFENCTARCYDYPFPAPQLSMIRRAGAIPMLNWSSMSTPLSRDEPGYSLARVAGGAYDDYLRSFARAARAWGHPFLLRFDWEMNGDWFPWAERANGNHPGDFVRAWRHVHELFTSAGAGNASWVWCPSTNAGSSAAQLADLYPGGADVDWTCMDGYNYGALHGASNWMSFSDVFAATYRDVRRLGPDKPTIIGEVASSQRGGSKAAWIADMFRKLPRRFPNVRGVVWFDTPDGVADWPLQTSTSSLAAFRAGIISPRYVGSRFARLATRSVLEP